MAHIKAVLMAPRVHKNKGPKKKAPKVQTGKVIRTGFGQYRRTR